ncbi:helix-turn-helix transcriptional regulator [Sphingobacterium sp.]|uniref:helix-turn-helix domain-containing protein n=1 Tax=Sphingobacterium sp. TaxID=341027 RepID=UPI00289B503E|nr:helix-turn-helix transcriptional regulator [Sphingobacterium sp.]
MKYKPEPNPLKTLFKKQHVFIEELPSNFTYSLINNPVRIEVPQKTKYFSVVLIEDGDGVVEIEGQTFEIQQFKVVVLFPGQYRSCDILNGTNAHHLMVKSEVYHKVSLTAALTIEKLSPIWAFDASPRVFAHLRDEILKIKEILDDNKSENEELIINRFKTVFLILKAECMDFSNLEILNVTHPSIEKFVQLVEENFRSYKNVTFYADKIYIQPNYLNILCKSVLKVSAKQFIKNRIIKEAKFLLISSNKSVKQISFELGTTSPNQFTLFFKRETGINPKDFFKLRKLASFS